MAARLAGAQTQAGERAVVGVFGIALATRSESLLTRELPRLLAELGWVEGRNLNLVERYGAGKMELLPQLANELVQAAPSVIIASGGNVEAEALKRLTTTIPIVVTGGLDPVGTGLVQSLAHPGGNVTGVMWAEPGLGAKITEFVKEIVPAIRRYAILYMPEQSGLEVYMVAFEAAAKSVGFATTRVPVHRREDVAPALETIRRMGVDAFGSAAGPILTAENKQIVDFAIKNKLPSFFVLPFSVYAGGLLSYSPNHSNAARRVASIVGKILKGFKPAEIPFEHPTQFDLVVNLKTAKAIGLKIPQSILLRADHVIE
jgi:ABC-type uncharacterized transport system substrate-binding protein